MKGLKVNKTKTKQTTEWSEHTNAKQNRRTNENIQKQNKQNKTNNNKTTTTTKKKIYIYIYKQQTKTQQLINKARAQKIKQKQ